MLRTTSRSLPTLTPLLGPAPRDLGQVGLQARAVHRGLHRFEGVGGHEHVDRAVLRVHDDVVGTGFDRHVGDAVFVRAGGEREHAELPEHEGDRAVGAEVAAELAERMAHVGHGADLVVGEAVDDHSDAAGRVALVADFHVGHAFEFARGLLDRAFDDVLRHVHRQAAVDRRAQARVGRGVAAAGARRDADLADHLGEDLAALCVDRVLARFDGRATTHGRYRLLYCEGARFYSPKRPDRRNATAWSAACAENSRPLWLASTTTWSVTPSRRVSSTATVPSWSPAKWPKKAPSPCGTRPAMTPTSARPCQHGRPDRSRSPLRPSNIVETGQRSMPAAAPLPVSGEPRQTTRRTGRSGASHSACKA